VKDSGDCARIDLAVKTARPKTLGPLLRYFRDAGPYVLRGCSYPIAVGPHARKRATLTEDGARQENARCSQSMTLRRDCQ
jgi:hypothetical protein